MKNCQFEIIQTWKNIKQKTQYLQFTFIKVSSLKSIYMKQKTLYLYIYFVA